jgi:hypothetical protein
MVSLIKLVSALIVFSIALLILGGTFYGIYLGFSASVILGIIILFIEPLPLIFGLVQLFGHVNLAQKIVEWFNKQ